MTTYRFCGADDLPLLVEAHNRCWLPHFPHDARLTVADLETQVRELQICCASSIVAFDADVPIGVLLAAKRESEVLVYRLAVHPGHLRKGHGRKLLAALSAQRAVAGPHRIVAEVPAELDAPCALFERCDFARDAVLTDYALDPAAHSPGATGAPPDDWFLVAITIDDVLADPMLGGITAPSWERSAQTLIARKERIEGLALAALNDIAAFLLYRKLDAGRGTEILALRALNDEDGESAAGCLLDATVRRTPKPLAFNAAHPDEVPAFWLAAWGFRQKRSFVRYTADS